MLILVRHAHADWPHYNGPDFDRPLTEKGLADAHATGQAIHAAGLQPKVLLASPAARTGRTARILAQELGLPEAAILYVDSLYNGSAQTLESVARTAATSGVDILLVAHNPGVSNLARALANDPDAPPYKPGDWRVLAL